MALITLDSAAKRGVYAVQRYSLLSARALANLFRRPFYGAEIITQMDSIGVGSPPLVFSTAFFPGGVLRRPFYGCEIITQIDSIGVGSLPIVILTGFFTGGVLALQSASTLATFGATAVTGQLVSLSMIKELGPVLTSLMVSRRHAPGLGRVAC